MTATRKPLTRADLAPLARAATGPHRTLTAVTRLRGGSRKGVYRLTLDDGTTVVAYVWSAAEDYWDAGPSDPFSQGTGLDLFTAGHDRLTAVGVRVPRLLYTDATHTRLPADAAIVEDLSGGSLEDLLHRDPQTAPAAMERLADLLATLHAVTGPRVGEAAPVEGALRSIEEAAAREPRIAAVREELTARVRELAAEVRPRARHTLIHGELGPDHVLLTPDGHPVLIDIEGLRHADVEQEHVFLRLRFGRHYDALRVPGLDEHRLRLYRLAMHLGLVAGPLRLLDGDFPDPAPMRAIAEHNLQQTLTLLRSAS
ncbi:phosphotransferase family protein [Streptomyces lanatus]|uniref:Aminoglycoside phosphotransferase family protein n=1 Tax=Streptomyces lanatus TaxID=66900 RepID=A0ABV1XK76_9ACTN|nr:aminoglycoside phosphotransferase family protein [Streptomyces lanatus]GHG95873.1 aminoglycoside phosphotransferase [Streptomyces lanatus]